MLDTEELALEFQKTNEVSFSLIKKESQFLKNLISSWYRLRRYKK